MICCRLKICLRINVNLLQQEFNSRVAERPDYVENENEFINDLWPDGYVSDDILPRKSQDKTVNEYDRSLLEFCKASGLRILNGRLGVDGSVGKYTCTNVHGSSVIDMVLTKYALFDLFNYFEVHDPNNLSGQCVVDICISSCIDNIENCDKNVTHNTTSIPYMYKWDNIKKDLYVNALSADEISHQLDMLSQTIDVAESTSDINDSLHSFCNVLGEVT